MQLPNDSKLRRLTAYGVTIGTDLALEDFLVRSCKDGIDLVVMRREWAEHHADAKRQVAAFEGHGRRFSIFTDRDFALSTSRQPWCFEVADVVRFGWLGSCRRIDYEVNENASHDLVAFWLIHIFLPLYFTLEARYEFIHAGAVDVGGDTVLFVAPSHGGKSTLTDFFVQRGHALVSDDKVATYEAGGNYIAVPSHPCHRPFREFEVLGHRVEYFDPSPRPISAIYALQASSPDVDISIDEFKGHEKFAQLLPGYLFNFGFLLQRRLQFLAGLANDVPFYRIGLPWNMERLDEVYGAIQRHQAVQRR